MKRLLTVGVFVLQGLGVALAVPFADIGGTTKEVSPSDTLTTTYGASADATITLKNATGTGLYATGFNLVVTNCTVTIDASDVGTDLVWFGGDVATYGTGKILIKGVDTATFGDAMPDGPSDTSLMAYWADVAFEDAGGAGVVFTNGVTLLRKPTGTWSIAKDTAVAVRNGGLLGDAENGLDVKDFNLFLLDESGDPSVMGKITVEAGRWVSCKPCSVGYDKTAHSFTWSGGAGSVDNDIELKAGASLYAPNRPGGTTLTFNGKISGEGEMIFKTFAGAKTFAGDCSSFGGTITVDIADLPLTVTGSLACNALDVRKSGFSLTIAKDASFAAQGVSGRVVASGAGTLTAGLLETGCVKVVGLVDERMSGDGLQCFNGPSSRLYLSVAGSGAVCDLAGVADLLQGESYDLNASDGVTYANVPTTVRLSVGADVSATLLAGTVTNATQVAEGGTLTVGDGIDRNWREHVMKWIDPNVEASITGLTNGNNNVVRTRIEDTEMPWAASGRKFIEIDTITDCREGNRDWTFQCSKTFSNPGSGIVPLLATNALNGLNVLSFGAGRYARRVSHWTCSPEEARVEATRPKAGASFKPKFAVLVFGSQGGGGQALFGTDYPYYLKRGGTNDVRKVSDIDYRNKDQPIFANDVPTWVDGERVDATLTPFSGGWQILSVDCSGAAGVCTLGCTSLNESKASCGGQAYGEILFFDQVLGDAERLAVERYLADRWGLSGQYKGTVVQKTVRIAGKGELKLASDLTVEGSFDGSINANGRTLSVSDLPVPPGDEVVSAAHPDRWFDPEIDGAVETTASKNVDKFYDRLLAHPLSEMENGQVYLSACGRQGKLDVGTRGGAAKNWINYIGTTGNLRFRKKGETTGETSVYNPMNVKALFLVHDSTYGGGTPFQTTKGGGSRITRAAGTLPTDADVQELVKVPIWDIKTSANGYLYPTLRDASLATTYLDGKPIDGTTDGFGGKPEVLSFRSTQAVQIGTFANLYYNNTPGAPYPTNCGEVQSEIILFENEITEATRQQIEGYLAWKWLGEVHDGYSSLHGATLTGSGAVQIPVGVAVPQFGADFTGSVQLASDALAFMVTSADPATPVEGLIDVGGGTFAPRSPCTLTVTVADGVNLRSGAFYPLVMGAWADGVDVSLSIAADAKGRELTLESRDDVLGLAVGKPGLMLLVK